MTHENRPQKSQGESAAAEFRVEAVPSPFEVDRAITAYLPLLEACYARAHQRPFAFPAGYEAVAEITASAMEMAEAGLADPPVVQEAVRNDMTAAEAAVADPAAFGFVVREHATGAILLCIRGTQTPGEWLHNFTAVPNPFTLVADFGLVHLGFERMHRSVRGSIQSAVTALPPDTRITVVGHSLGGAMAILAAVDLKRNLHRTNVDVCTVGGPRVGKTDFRRNFNREIPGCFRITNQFDIVPHVPSLLTAWNHVGEEIEVNGRVENAHSLDAYLQGLRNIGTVREVSISGLTPEVAYVGVRSMRVP
jgi:triacylglycerol lipase